MADKTLIYVGSDVDGLYRKAADDASWEKLSNGLPPSPRIRAIAFHPEKPKIVFAGTQRGVYKSSNQGDTWTRTNLPEGRVVWSLKFHPQRPNVMFLGTEGSEVFKSEDGGDNWEFLSSIQNPDAVQMRFSTRIMGIAIESSDSDHMYAAMEVGGAATSADGGKTWRIVNKNFAGDTERMDLHGVAMGPSNQSVLIANCTGLWRTGDQGENWENLNLERFSPLSYSRGVEAAPNDYDTLYACVGLNHFSEEGGVLRSTDGGDSWHRFDKGVEPLSTTFGIGINDRDPQQVYFCTKKGQVFGTPDGGNSWKEHTLPELAGDLKSIACTTA